MLSKIIRTGTIITITKLHHIKIFKKGLTIQIILICLCPSACTNSTFKTPVLPLPNDWGEHIKIIYAPKNINNNQWWQSFAPLQLQQLRQKLHTQNIDLKQAKLNIKKAKLNLSRSNSDMRPNFSTSMSYGIGANKFNNEYIASKSKGSSLSISYEVDYLLKKQDNLTIDSRIMQSSQLLYQITQIIQETTLAESYWQLMFLLARKKRHPLLLKLNQKKLNILKAQHKEGMITVIDVENASNEYHQLQSQTYELAKQEQELRNNIVLLIGEIPDCFQQYISPLTINTKVAIVPIGLPASTLAKRPDIQIALLNLQNNWQKHITSFKVFFPNIALSGSSGESTLALEQLIISPISVAASLGASLSFNFFQKNIERNAIELEYQSSLLSYEKTLYQALNETSLSLGNIIRLNNEEKMLKERLLASQKQLKVERLRWQEGIVGKINVIQSSISNIQTELAVINNKLSQLNETMTLYKVLGGIDHGNNNVTTVINDE